MDQNHHVIFGHLGLDRLHKGAVGQARCVVMVFDETRHQRKVIGRLLPPGIAERQHGHVKLTPAERCVLLAGLE